MHKAKKQGLLLGSVILISAAILSKIAGLIYKIPLTNILGGTGMGYYSSAYTVFTPICAVFAGSLASAVTQYISQQCRVSSPSNGITKGCLVVFGILSLGLSVIIWVLSGFIAKNIIGNAEAEYAIVAISPCIFIEAVTAIYRGYFEGRQNMTPTATSQAIEALSRIVFGLGFVLLSQSKSVPEAAAAAIWGVTASNLAGLVYLMIRAKLAPDAYIDFTGGKADYRAVKQIAKIMLPLGMCAIVSSLAGAIDLVTIVTGLKASAGSEAYAERYSQVLASGTSLSELPNYLYGTYTGLVGVVFSLVPSLCATFGRASLPSISCCYGDGNIAVAHSQSERLLLITSYISIPAGLGLCAISQEVLSILYSSRPIEVAVATLPLKILSLGTPFLCIGASAFSLLQSAQKQDIPLKITLCGTLIKLMGNLILVPKYDIIGAAVSTTLSYAVMGILSVVSLRTAIGLKTSTWITYIYPLLAGLIAVSGAKAITNLSAQSLPNLVKTGFCVCFAVIIYIIAVALLDITPKNEIYRKIFEK